MFAACGIIHWRCPCRQHRRCIIPQAANTV